MKQFFTPIPITWTTRKAEIMGPDGPVFSQDDVEAPASWSDTAVNVVASKYFRGHLGTPQRERSVRALIARVVNSIVQGGLDGGYYGPDYVEQFRDGLTHLLVHQMMAFNSPVWFNLGAVPNPQLSACFTQSVEDSMDSIMGLAASEAKLFKGGSGTGSNFSPIRSSRELLSGGGTASGPVSFMRGFDSFAGVIKSGGRTRRAAKLVCLNDNHPDILDFIWCKALEEKKAQALIDAGYNGAFNVPGGAYDSVSFQNANNSIQASDAFMQAVLDDADWTTHAVLDGHSVQTYRARDIWDQIGQAAWTCGDPGVQFSDTINSWHTCPNTDRINTSNPCGEFLFLDDTSCNLASLNLMKFRKPDGSFDIEAFILAIELTIMAQDILVDLSSYPTEKITERTRKFRPLGLGYANLGAFLMARGLPYGSDEGRVLARAITSLMTATAYKTSSMLADSMGLFGGWEHNGAAMQAVLERHGRAHMVLTSDMARWNFDSDLSNFVKAGTAAWNHVNKCDAFRNSQVTVLAPCGTIGFMMDVDTTGVEPDTALVKYKKLVGGGTIKIVNQTVREALGVLGYSQDEVRSILDHLDQHDTIEGSVLKDQHLPVFDCAIAPRNGKRSISVRDHLAMMMAVQPFLSGGISKTVNMSSDSTPEDILNTYMSAWKMGLKSVAIYRDGSKRTQPINTGEDKVKESARPARTRLPDERPAITHKFSIAGHEGYMTVGQYPDTGRPGELFLTMSKEGSVVSGLMDSFATAVSLALQYGVPLETLVDKFVHTRFEPSGFTKNRDIPIAKSLVDYIFRWLSLKFLEETPVRIETPVTKVEVPVRQDSRDAPPCLDCGTLMVRNGACHKCPNCGSTSGCS